MHKNARDMKTGIKFKPCNVQSAREHNKRDKKYLENVEKSDHKYYDLFHDQTFNNEYWTNPEYLELSYTQILDDLKVYVKDMTGRSMQEKANPIREGVCPVKPDTTIEDFTPFVNWLTSHGLSVISIDIHHDEGHVDAETLEREYNHHAHIVCNWIHPNGKSVKLSQADCSTMQTVLAQSLGMERGTPAEETGARHIPHLEYREMKAAENARRLEEKVNLLETEVKDKLQELAQAQEQLQLASAEASKETLKGNLYDVGARIAGIFGRGAVAESRNDAAEAQQRAAKAEAKAAEAVAAQVRAENARKQAENARISAEQAEKRAKDAKAQYGREMLEKGRKEGAASAEEKHLREIDLMIVEKNAEVDAKEAVIAKHKKFTDQVLKIFPRLEDLDVNLKVMTTAGLKPEEITKVIAEGKADATVKVPYAMKNHLIPATVEMERNQKGQMRVRFNKSPWTEFVQKAVEMIKRTLSKGKGLKP